MKFGKFFIVLFFAIGLNACGYHLRGMGGGTQTAKFKNVFLEGASGSLREQFGEVLRMSSGKLAASPEGADLLIKVLNEKFNRRAVSLNFSGRSNEFELSYRLEFQLAGADTVFLASDKPLEINRSYFNDQQYMLAKNEEENVIRGEIYREAVMSILNRANSQIKKQ